MRMAKQMTSVRANTGCCCKDVAATRVRAMREGFSRVSAEICRDARVVRDASREHKCALRRACGREFAVDADASPASRPRIDFAALDLRPFPFLDTVTPTPRPAKDTGKL